MKAGHKIKKPEKLNLVPILDSVFIFIFFLLMSAQFVEVYEIGSSIPMSKNIDEEKTKKDPLNLTLEIFPQQIIVKTGLRQIQSRSFAHHEKMGIKNYLQSLKQKHPDENTMIVRADSKITFQNLITVIDSTQGRINAREGKLFEQIVFDQNGVR
jgi:biopolymer transport protein ExbD